MVDAATALLARILDDDHELLTVIAGADADAAGTAAIEAWVRANHPEVEVEVHQGGQPLYPYYFGLE
jgi:dihydroxyacetone kinase-like predicted kinase